MELLEGCDLSQLVKRHGALTITACRHIIEQTCHGLAAAHDEGIVHRDPKPQGLEARHQYQQSFAGRCVGVDR